MADETGQDIRADALGKTDSFDEDAMLLMIQRKVTVSFEQWKE